MRLEAAVLPIWQARASRPPVPGNGQRLPAPLHRVLPQGLDAEGVADAQPGQFAVRAIAVHAEAAIAVLET
ncbi:hypothetical protein E5198_13610 [Pseudomonas sp. A-1]|uniref:hypothetical protein n=1 Tax=Pseudomonas sp. A-1 TaxID=1821274 RepID=UPI0010A68150|nr:hypothetical protein [Pseudomonas sp. A-1]THG80605.1 hypothetical protein E5198_13610 [Pseudomonas sp. A-1]